MATEREQKQRESERRKEEAAATEERERREKAVAKAQAAIERAKAEHDQRASKLESEGKTAAGGGRALGEAKKEAGDGCTARAYRLAAPFLSNFQEVDHLRVARRGLMRRTRQTSDLRPL